MLGVFRTDQSGKAITKFFAETAYENAFVVSEDMQLHTRIEQHEWRRFLALAVDDNSRIELLLPSFEDICTRARTPARAATKSRYPAIEAVLDKDNLRLVNTTVRNVHPRALHASGLIMAGGFGRRLGELTKNTPKPMLDLCGKPIAEHLVDNFLDSGINDIFMSVYHLSDVVKDHFGNGSAYGARVRYLEETSPLGTAGCLSLLPRDVDRPILMVNGDVVTDVHFGRLVEYHQAAQFDVTVSVRPHPVQLQFGVIEQTDGLISRIREKPKIIHQINVAIYVISPNVLAHIPAGKPIDMPSLIEKLIPLGYRVGVFPLVEEWIDVGTVPDLERARTSFETEKRRSTISYDSADLLPFVEARAVG